MADDELSDDAGASANARPPCPVCGEQVPEARASDHALGLDRLGMACARQDLDEIKERDRQRRARRDWATLRW